MSKSSEQEDIAQQISDLQQAVQQNPNDFEAYINLIDIYTEQQNHQYANYYRLQCSDYFCLSEDIWEDCIEAQQQIDPHDAEKITEMFQQALKDYKYKIICQLYNEFIINDFKYATFQQFQDVISIMLQNMQIWKLSYDDEQADKMRDLIIQFALKFETKIQKENVVAFQQQIKHVFLQMILFPNKNIGKYFQQYCDWDTGKAYFDQMKEKYEKSKQYADFHLKIQNEYTKAFAKLDEEDDLKPLLNFVRTDLKNFAVKDNGVTKENFGYIQLYFEQFLPEFTKNHFLWEAYVDMGQLLCKNSEIKQELYTRALKNCNHIPKFWIGLFSEMEKSGQLDLESLQNMVNSAIQQQGQELNINFCFQLYQFELEFFQRQNHHLSWTAEEFCENLWSPIQEFLGQFPQSENLLEQLGEDVCKMCVYRVSGANQEGYHKLMVSLQEKMIKQNGQESKAWLKYISYLKTSFARSWTDKQIQNVRGLYKRSLEFAKDETKQLQGDFLSFEKCYGNIITIQKAQNWLNSKKPEKLELESPEQDSKKVQIFVENLPKINEDKLIEIIKKKGINPLGIRLVKNQRIAYLDVYEDQAKQIIKSLDKVEIENEIIRVHLSKPPESDQDLNNRTIYAQNLPNKVQESEIKSAFTKCGPIQEIRIKVSSTGKTFCYIQFEKAESVDKALQLNGHKLFGCENLVEIQRTRSKEDIRKDRDTNKGVNTIHITNLSYSSTESDITNWLTKVFNIKAVKVIIICEKQSSKSKGYGYIQLSDQGDMEAILQKYDKMDRCTMDGRPIVMRDASKKYQNSNKSIEYDDKEKRDKSHKRKRDVKSDQKHKVKSVTQAEKNETNEDKKASTNNDFKKFLGF